MFLKSMWSLKPKIRSGVSFGVLVLLCLLSACVSATPAPAYDLPTIKTPFVSLEEAQRRVTFKIMVPKYLPPGIVKGPYVTLSSTLSENDEVTIQYSGNGHAIRIEERSYEMVFEEPASLELSGVPIYVVPVFGVATTAKGSSYLWNFAGRGFNASFLNYEAEDCLKSVDSMIN
jgi:hypothetical protein